MWTVTVNSNVPIVASAKTGENNHNFSLTGYKRTEDVEELLGSYSPMRARSRSVKNHSLAIHTPARRSVSPDPTKRQAYSDVAAVPQTREDWRQQWTHALMNTVSEKKDSSGLTFNSGHDVEKNLTAVLDKSKTKQSQSIPLKAVHNSSVSSQDLNCGFNIGNSGKDHLTFDDMKTSITPKITRSASMSRLTRSVKGDSPSLPSGRNQKPDVFSQSVREIRDALDESESRRGILLQKLKDTQTALELQSKQLKQIESAAKANSMIMEDLKLKEKEYRKTVSQLEASEEEKKNLQTENLRLRDELQDRINGLDYKLKLLKSQHSSTEGNNTKHATFLDHSTTVMSLLEDENTKLQQDKQKLQSELFRINEVFDLTKVRLIAMDNENKSNKSESVKLKEDNAKLSKKVQEMANQMIELRSLLQAVRDENERLFSTWKTSTADHGHSTKQIKSYQDTVTDLRLSLSAITIDRDRLFQEKLNLNSKLQDMMLENEKLIKSKLALEDQLSELPSHQSHTGLQEFHHKVANTKSAAEKKNMNDPTEGLAVVKQLHKHALEQVAALEQEKAKWQSQHDLIEQARYHLQKEVDRLSQENTKIQDRYGTSFPTAEYKKLLEEHENLQTELKKRKDENDSLSAKYHLLVIKYGQDGELVEKDRAEMKKLKEEKDALQKEAALFQGQMLLMESGKKRSDEQIKRLNSELEEIRAQSYQNNHIKSDHAEEVSSLKQEVEDLKSQLDKAKANQTSHDIFRENFQEQNIKDSGVELQQMKDKIKELNRTIEQKDHARESLELELKFTKELTQTKEDEVLNLRKALENLERENQMLHQDIQTFSRSQGLEPVQHPLKRSKSVRTLKEELEEVLKAKQKGDFYDTDHNTHTNKTMDHLQPLGSSYISQVPDKSIADFSKLLSKSWSNTSGPSMESSNEALSSAQAVRQSETQEREEQSQIKLLRKPVKKLPPLPPAKHPVFIPARTSAISSSTQSDESSNIVKTPTTVNNSKTVSMSVTQSGPQVSLNTDLINSELDKPQPNTQAVDVPRQKDIEVLINKFDEMAAF